MNILDVINRNEATVQAELYRRLYDNGVKSYLEIKIKNQKRKLNSIVDIVVVDEAGEIIYFIEVKSRTLDEMRFKQKTKQEERYEELEEIYNIPFIYCRGYDEIDSVVDTILKYKIDKEIK